MFPIWKHHKVVVDKAGPYTTAEGAAVINIGKNEERYIEQ